jgi:uncharacterized protein YqhQ
MAVRRPNGELVLSTRPIKGIYAGKVRDVPFVRGVIVLLEAMIFGIQSLIYSANIALEEENEEISGPMMWAMVALSITFAVALFFLAPLFLVNLIDPHLGSSLLSNIIEGIIRIAVFLLYLIAINLISDVRKVFAYHGAEHKAVNAYEGGVPLEVEEVKKYSTAHVRCGTSFLLYVLVIAIILFALLGQPDLWIRILSRILLLPVIAGIGYELTRVGAAFADNKIMRLFLSPGLALQSLTTRQPNDSQIEAAISALKLAVDTDNVQSTVAEEASI